MTNKQGKPLQPKCFLSHNLINKLSVIVGSCDIVRERTGNSGHFDSECSHRIDTIQQIARAMADDLNEHECELTALGKLEILDLPERTSFSKTKH